MDPLTILALAKGAAAFIPSIAGWLGGDKAEEKANTVVNVVEQVTGLSGQSAIDALKDNPELVAAAEKRIHEKLRMEFDNLNKTQETMQLEISNADPFVRRARPTFLYVVAGTIALEAVIAFVAVFTDAATIKEMTSLFEALAIPQSIAATMCGVYMKKRSDEKTGLPKQGLLSKLIS